jgi:hypothetical protein
MRLSLKCTHKLQLILLEISELVPVFDDRRHDFISGHVHCALNQAVVTRECRYFLVFLLR